MTIDRVFVDKCFHGVNPDDIIGDFNKLTDYYLKID